MSALTRLSLTGRSLIGLGVAALAVAGLPAIQATGGRAQEAGLGLGLAVLAILLFTLSLWSTVVTAVTMALSLAITLGVLHATGLSLTVPTLGALGIVVGRLTADSLLVLEGITRRLATGLSARQAVQDGAGEATRAVLASGCATAAVFLPFLVFGGVLRPFAITVVVAVAASLVLSLTVVPALAYWFLKSRKQLTAPGRTAPVLRFATRHRLVTMVVAVGVLAATGFLLARVQTDGLDDASAPTEVVGKAPALISGPSRPAPSSDKMTGVSAFSDPAVDAPRVRAGAGARAAAQPPGRDRLADLGMLALAALALLFAIMVAGLDSFVQPLIALVSLPFAATGAAGALVLTGAPLSLSTVAGLLLPAGIGISTAIVLLDLINQYRERGMGIRAAAVEAGSRRLQPVLLTVMATICALLPAAFGRSGDGFISTPLALAVIGGLVSSTVFTLVLVPTLYTSAETLKRRVRRRRARRRPAAAVHWPERDLDVRSVPMALPASRRSHG